MLSTLLSFPTMIITNFIMNPMFLIGYAVCVLCPIPFLNSFIISMWSKFGSQIMSLFSSAEITVETGVENAVTTTISNVTTTITNSVTSKL